MRAGWESPVVDRQFSAIANRKSAILELPDAIIAATALEAGATLITDDAQLRKLAAVTSIGLH